MRIILNSSSVILNEILDLGFKMKCNIVIVSKRYFVENQKGALSLYKVYGDSAPLVLSSDPTYAPAIIAPATIAPLKATVAPR